jgi:hypothetical protein
MAMNLNHFLRRRRQINVNGVKRGSGILGAVMLVALFGSSTAAVASPARCDMRLTVELTPDIPNPRDVGFLSSLLSDHASYRLSLWQEPSDSLIVLELTGPGPDYRCENVVEAIRRDGRVLSVHVQQEPT